MKVTFPHMGHLWIVLTALFRYLNIEPVVPPLSSKRTLELGAKYAPEFACLPLKLNIGNFIEAFFLGADTIVMPGGRGPCRFGYYGQVEHAILNDLGYNYKLVTVEPPEKFLSGLMDQVRRVAGPVTLWQVIGAVRFGFQKARAVDELENKAFYLRPREIVRGSTDQALQRALKVIERVFSPKDLPPALARARQIMSEVNYKEKNVLRVGVVGEIYTLLEPFSNMNLEVKLGRLGVEVDRSISLSSWINDHLLGGLAKGVRSSKKACQASFPYLRNFVGGHGQEGVGNTVLYGRKGYDGVIHLLPFTCMPEIIARSVLPAVSGDLGIPVMTVVVDEHAAEAGLMTRLEAFVDLIEERQRGVWCCLK